MPRRHSLQWHSSIHDWWERKFIGLVVLFRKYCWWFLPFESQQNSLYPKWRCWYRFGINSYSQIAGITFGEVPAICRIERNLALEMKCIWAVLTTSYGSRPITAILCMYMKIMGSKGVGATAEFSIMDCFRLYLVHFLTFLVLYNYICDLLLTRHQFRIARIFWSYDYLTETHSQLYLLFNPETFFCRQPWSGDVCLELQCLTCQCQQWIFVFIC